MPYANEDREHTVIDASEDGQWVFKANDETFLVIDWLEIVAQFPNEVPYSELRIRTYPIDGHPGVDIKVPIT